MYTAYGTGIESEFSFGALPVYRPRQGDGALIKFQVARTASLDPVPASYTNFCRAQGRDVYVEVGDTCVSIQVGAFAAFRLYTTAGRIDCECLDVVPDPLLLYWIVQQVLPMFLLWNGTAEFLHGMAVSLALDSQQCVGFLGDSHAGKSTLLNHFLAQGHTLVSDDHLAVARHNYSDVLPATPYYRPYRAGEDLGHVAERFSPDPSPLHRIYLLEPTFAYAPIEAHPVEGMSAIEALLPHIQYNLHNPALPQLFPLVAERFSGLNRLVRQVSIKRLHVPRDLNRLPEVYDFIQNDLVSRSQ